MDFKIIGIYPLLFLILLGCTAKKIELSNGDQNPSQVKSTQVTVRILTMIETSNNAYGSQESYDYIPESDVESIYPGAEKKGEGYYEVIIMQTN